MGTSPFSIKPAIFLLLLFHSPLTPSSATTNLPSSSSISQPQPTTLNYHNGPILTGSNLSLSIVWYGHFKPSHKSILLDFLSSLTPTKTPPPPSSPFVSSWWESLESYTSLIPSKKKKSTSINVHKQTTLDSYPLGRVMTRSRISSLADKAAAKHEDKGNIVIIIFTDKTVAVEGFCMSSCARHGSVGSDGSGRVVYIWVGDPVDQCPGQCAWPFHRPIYGPQTPPLVTQNGDVGADGMVIGLATALAGAVTNPYGSGFFQGPAAAPLEAVTACAGAYGSGWYPGYAGEVLVDEVTGGSYNAYGVNGRKFLVPGSWDPVTGGCMTLV